ncbi:MAG: hypothetical protein AB7I79_18470 [Rhizobiaceae bacterium]
MPRSTLAELIASYGADAKAKLSSMAVDGAPEDQLRNPLEVLIRGLWELHGLPLGVVRLVERGARPSDVTRAVG